MLTEILFPLKGVVLGVITYVEKAKREIVLRLTSLPISNVRVEIG
jgi:hypothetical protein